MPLLRQDFETLSACPLESAGVWNYARHPSTEGICAALAFDDDEPELWWAGQDLPDRFATHMERGGPVECHGVEFEWNIQNNVFLPLYGWPALDLEQMDCTQARSSAMALPASLKGAAAALGCHELKDDDGWRLMQEFSTPRGWRSDGTPFFWRESDVLRSELPLLREKLRRLGEYCKQDVRTQRAISKAARPLPPFERRVWLLNCRMNDRGIGIDVPAVAAAIELVETEKNRLDAELKQLTGGAVRTVMCHAALAKWIAAQGVTDFCGTDKDTVWELLERPDLPKHVERALEIRQAAAKPSNAKLPAMLGRVSPDGRARGLQRYHGACTGRKTAYVIQPYNMTRPRDDITYADIEAVVRRLPLREPGFAEYLTMMYGSVIEITSDCLRSFIKAASGYQFVGPDYAAFEMVGLAFLAGQDDIFDLIREHGTKYLYRRLASRVFDIPSDQVGKGEKYQCGKIGVLTGGYGGGERALLKNFRRAHVRTTKELRLAVRDAYREENPAIRQYWYDLEHQAMEAVRRPGKVTVAGPRERQVRFQMSGSFLRCRVPSGSKLYYPYPEIVRQQHPDSNRTSDGLICKGMDEDTNQWKVKKLYGGKWAQNVTERFTRDILCTAMLRLDAAGYPLVLDVYDEVVAETKNGDAERANIERIVSQVPHWAQGMPLTVEAFVGERYRK